MLERHAKELVARITAKAAELELLAPGTNDCDDAKRRAINIANRTIDHAVAATNLACDGKIFHAIEPALDAAAGLLLAAALWNDLGRDKG